MKPSSHTIYADAIRSLRFYFLGPSKCRYSIGCIDFTVHAFLTKPYITALKLSVLRILSCNPFTKIN